MPLPRIRLRTLMIAVAVVGSIFAAGLMLYRRSTQFQALARRHAEYVTFATAISSNSPGGNGKLIELDRMVIVVGLPWSRERADWHLLLRDKYRRAARYPWLPVPPDPPEPK